jgi:Pentapeptide repeats (8 copies)
LFAVRRGDIESFAGNPEARGSARATVTRRLCTIAGFYKYAVEKEAPGSRMRTCPEASLVDANLTRADLTTANLADTDLTGARLSEQDPVPEGWERDPATGRLMRAST